MKYEVIIIVILLVTAFIYLILRTVDNLLKRFLIDVIKELRDEYGHEKYYSLEELQEVVINNEGIRNDANRILVWMYKWVLANKKNLRRRLKNSLAIEENNNGEFRLKVKDIEIDQAFKWNDPIVYEWKISREKDNIFIAIWMLFLSWIIFTLLFFFLFWLIDLVLPLVALILASRVVLQ